MLLLCFQTAIINFGLVLGFNTFYYSVKHKSFINSKWLYFHCKFMAFVFLIAYPLGLLFHFYEDNFTPVGITDYARISLSIANWLLCFAIYLNQVSNSSSICSIYNQAIGLNQCFMDMFKDDQNVINDLKFKFIKTCSTRSFILFTGFIAINHEKYWRSNTSHDSFYGIFFYFSLFLPSIIITFASNRFYTVATCSLYFIAVGNKNLRNILVTCREFIDLQDITLLREKFLTFVHNKILMTQSNHTALHQLFTLYHKLNSKYVIFIIGYCILNVIFEVKFIFFSDIFHALEDLNRIKIRK